MFKAEIESPSGRVGVQPNNPLHLPAGGGVGRMGKVSRVWIAKITVAALVISAASSLSSATPVPPPTWADEETDVAPTVVVDLVRELRLGSFVAHFEKTTLRQIRERIGAGAIEHAGDAAGSMTWLCYSLPGQRVWLVSTEMGGSDDVLMQVMADTLSASAPAEPSCPPMPDALRPISLPFGWLGTTSSALRKTFGKPSRVRGDWHVYFFDGKQRGPYPGSRDATAGTVEWDVAAYVELQIQNERVVKLRASHGTSY